jgi:hypothetical protein
MLESEPGVGTTVSLRFPAHRLLSTGPSADQASEAWY